MLSLEAHSSLEFVVLSRKVFSRFFGDTDQVTSKYVSLKLIGSNVLTDSKVYPVTVLDSLPSNVIELHSLALLQQYGSDFGVESCLVRPIDKLPHLDVVVMSFPPEVASLLERCSRQKLVDIWAQEHESDPDFLIMKKDDQSRTLNGTVVHCEPCDQGFADKETQFIVMRGEALQAPYVQQSIALSVGRMQGSKLFDTAALSCGELDDYTSGISIATDDETAVVAMTAGDMNDLGILSGDIVDILGEQPVRVRVLAFIDPNNFNRGTVYMSPVLLLNLNWPNRVAVAVNGQDTSDTSIESMLPVATSLTLARVSTPATLDATLQHVFMLNLKKYFDSRRRVVSHEFYIPIPLDSELARSVFMAYDMQAMKVKVLPEGVPDTIAWFKVTGGTYEENGEQPLLNTQCVVDPHRTRLIQAGVVAEPLPFGDKQRVLKEYLGIHSQYLYPSVEMAGKRTFQYATTLKKIINTGFDIHGLETSVLVSSSSRSMGKSVVVRSVSEDTGSCLLELDGYDLLNAGSSSKTIGTIRGKADRVIQSCSRVIIFIKHIEALCKSVDQQQQQLRQQSDSLSTQIVGLMAEYAAKNTIMVFSANEPDAVSDILRSRIKFEVEVTVPTDGERRLIFSSLLNHHNANDQYDYRIGDDVSLETLALQSAGLTPNDISCVVTSAKNNALERIEVTDLPLFQRIALDSGYVKIAASDFEKSINAARGKNSDSMGAPKIPDVKWEDVGGLDSVKGEILDTIDMPLKHPELFGGGMKKRSGILFYGPPGTGKTLLAKAIATNFALNFFSVKGPELLNMYIGESEANVRRVFQKARDAKPCVIFFDELDSVAPKRGNQGDSGGVMDRIVSQLLAELDGMSDADGEGVFVVGATNRPDLLDEALLRPGRFDKMLYLGISDTHEKQATIIQALTRKFKTGPDFQPINVAKQCPFNYTGADFYALCSDAMLNAMIRTAGIVDRKIKKYNEGSEKPVTTRYWFDNVATEKDTDVIVEIEDFSKARESLSASVSQDELQHYLAVKQNFEGK